MPSLQCSEVNGLKIIMQTHWCESWRSQWVKNLPYWAYMEIIVNEELPYWAYIEANFDRAYIFCCHTKLTLVDIEPWKRMTNFHTKSRFIFRTTTAGGRRHTHFWREDLHKGNLQDNVAFITLQLTLTQIIPTYTWKHQRMGGGRLATLA